MPIFFYQQINTHRGDTNWNSSRKNEHFTFNELILTENKFSKIILD